MCGRCSLVGGLHQSGTTASDNITAHLGENLSDHLQARLMVEVHGVATLNDILCSPWAKMKMGLRWLALRDGLMSVPGATAHAYVSTVPGGERPDIKLQLHHLSSPDERNPKKLVLDPNPGFSIGVVQQRPESRGSIHIRSPDPTVDPTIRANYLNVKDDTWQTSVVLAAEGP